MSKVRIRHNVHGYYQLRREPGVVSDLEGRGRRVQSAASRDGGKYVMDSRQGDKAPQGRWRVDVHTGDYRARAKNNKYQSLVRALDHAR
jgi:hypothetical protein